MKAAVSKDRIILCISALQPRAFQKLMCQLILMRQVLFGVQPD